MGSLNAEEVSTGATAPNGLHDDEYIQRPATLSDNLSAIVAQVNGCYRGDGSRLGWTTEADLIDGQRIDEDMLKDIITEKNNVLLLLIRRRSAQTELGGSTAATTDDGGDQREQEEENEGIVVVGTVLLEHKGDKAYLGMLTVRPNIQRAGLGKKLLAAAEDYVATTWHLNRVEMFVISTRAEIIAFYERRGYVMTSRREPSFPYGDPRCGMPKRDDLQFVVMEKRLESSPSTS